MGVYIKGIDIPEIKRGVAAIINIDDILFLKTADDIVLVPDHGDLIDRDEFEVKHINGRWYDAYVSHKAVLSAPVVIPAERSEE